MTSGKTVAMTVNITACSGNCSLLSLMTFFKYFFLIWTILKVLHLLQYYFRFFMFSFFGCATACVILAPQLGIKPAPPALEHEVLTTGLPGSPY